MKSFNQFCSEAVYFIEMSDFSAGGGNAKMKETGMTRDQVIALGQKNLARLKNKPKSAAAVAPAAPKRAPAAAAAPKAAPAAAPRSREQKNADNLRLGAELGGVAKLAAQQSYSYQNSPAGRAHAARMKREPAWKTASKGFKNRDYGIPDFVSDRRRERQSAMADANRDAGMSPAAAEKDATESERRLHKKNMGYMKNRKTGNYNDVGY
tara:strand:+ start:602 stop:1228 length:627 start_codon:yes stop_codon:yes gene_type:complete